MDLENLEHGEDNMGGLTEKFYYGYSDDVDSWPSLPAVPTIDTALVLEDNIAMKAGKKLYTGYMTQKTGKLSNPDIGETDGICQKHLFSIFHPGMAARLKGFIKASNNKGMVFFVPDAEGVYHMIGSEKFPARKVPEGDLNVGDGGPEGRRGASISFESYGSGPSPTYGGTIPLTEADSGSGGGS